MAKWSGNYPSISRRRPETAGQGQGRRAGMDRAEDGQSAPGLKADDREKDGHPYRFPAGEGLVVLSWPLLPPDCRAPTDDEFRLDQRGLARQCASLRRTPRVRSCTRSDPRASESEGWDQVERGSG